ncbi:hypothetical protein [Methanoregula sp. UBA64]|jgi:hypothetical protein|uniref:hypothetical protein n=1 Tax=Methanoregula sp. UBA64 TaxID=1915554 RepID=UPI0025E74882|nr:hypothetical protein [Methanoregula sp. UBA64]
MTRGPLPKKAIDEALPVAQARGMVILCKPGAGSVCDFAIAGLALTSLVRVKRSRRIHCPLPEIELQFAEPLARLRLVPATSERCRELWVCGQYGTMRFFRVNDNGLCEINRDGRPLAGT